VVTTCFAERRGRRCFFERVSNSASSFSSSSGSHSGSSCGFFFRPLPLAGDGVGVPGEDGFSLGLPDDFGVLLPGVDTTAGQRAASQ
jgi:hypothetical protein